MMNSEIDLGLLSALSCDIGSRPEAAPTPDALHPYVRSVDRDASSVIVEFQPDAVKLVESFSEAERQCCSSIGWEVDRVDGLRLRITAPVEVLDILADTWR